MPRAKRLELTPATVEDAAELALLHTGVAQELTRAYGRGAWSGKTSEKGILYAMRTSRVFVARDKGASVATLRLATKKPWAIDPKYFSPCKKPLYLLAMAVAPERQREGLGRKCLEQAVKLARQWPADAIRLDSYDAEAGAGEFYAKCGWTERGRTTYRETPLVYFEWLLKSRRRLFGPSRV